MKKLMFVLLVMAACKKKDITPTPQPCTCPVPVEECKTGKVLFAAKYTLIGGNYDTIQFVFKHNNCPEKNSNTYAIWNFAKAIKPVINNALNESIEFTVSSTEDKMFAKSGDYTFQLQTDSNLVLVSNKLKVGSVGFKRIK